MHGAWTSTPGPPWHASLPLWRLGCFLLLVRRRRVPAEASELMLGTGCSASRNTPFQRSIATASSCRGECRGFTFLYIVFSWESHWVRKLWIWWIPCAVEGRQYSNFRANSKNSQLLKANVQKFLGMKNLLKQTKRKMVVRTPKKMRVRTPRKN